MAFIHKYSTISQGNFYNKNILDYYFNNIASIETIHPEYKKVISGINLRRMSAIVKMGLANTLACIPKQKVGAIVVGTGLGSIHHTELFLSSFTDSELSVLSPTPFINSVHNTISGEIALHTKNKGYNSTYSQGGLSFEGALTDAILLTKEGHNVILGGVDESTPILNDIMQKMDSQYKFTTGSTFFNLSSIKKDSLAEIINCIITKKQKLYSFINENFNPDEDFIISGSSFCNNSERAKHLDYSKISGIYMSNSAFGIQLAVELLNSNITHIENHNLPLNMKRIFIINYATNNDVGITILRK